MTEYKKNAGLFRKVEYDFHQMAKTTTEKINYTELN